MAGLSLDPPASRQNSAPAVIAAGVLSIAALALLWYLFDVLLLIFAGVLLAVMFRAPSDWVTKHTPLSSAWALTLVLMLIFLLVGGAAWLLGAAVGQQAQAVAEQAPQMLERVRDRIEDYGWLADRLDDADKVLEGEERAFVGRGLSVVSATFGAIANVGLVLFMAVLLAAQPICMCTGFCAWCPNLVARVWRRCSLVLGRRCVDG